LDKKSAFSGQHSAVSGQHSAFQGDPDFGSTRKELNNVSQPHLMRFKSMLSLSVYF